jgi:hypothetical protein
MSAAFQFKVRFRRMNQYYLGDPEAVARAMEAVAGRGEAKAKTG